MITRTFTVLFTWLTVCCSQSFAKQVGEAITDMGDVSDTDPNGYKLMMISIGILFACVLTLIGVTTAYMMKGKKKSQ